MLLHLYSCNNLDDSVSREGQEMVILHRANLKRKKRNEKKDICCTVDSGTGGRLFVGERRAGSQANTIANTRHYPPHQQLHLCAEFLHRHVEEPPVRQSGEGPLERDQSPHHERVLARGQALCHLCRRGHGAQCRAVAHR